MNFTWKEMLVLILAGFIAFGVIKWSDVERTVEKTTHNIKVNIK